MDRRQNGEHRHIANVLRFGTPPQRVLARRLGIDKLLRAHQRFAQHRAVPDGATWAFTSIAVLHTPNDSASAGRVCRAAGRPTDRAAGFDESAWDGGRAADRARNGSPIGPGRQPDTERAPTLGGERAALAGGFQRADARTRTGDPFITRSARGRAAAGRVRVSRALAGFQCCAAGLSGSDPGG